MFAQHPSSDRPEQTIVLSGSKTHLILMCTKMCFPFLFLSFYRFYTPPRGFQGLFTIAALLCRTLDSKAVQKDAQLQRKTTTVKPFEDKAKRGNISRIIDRRQKYMR